MSQGGCPKKVVLHQGAFQEVNILMNRANMFHITFSLTESGIFSISKTIKVISNLKKKVLGPSWDIILRANFCPKGTFRLWPLLQSNLAIFDCDGQFTHQTGVRIARIRPIVAHGGEEDSRTKISVRAIKLIDAVLKVSDAALAITTFDHNFKGFPL